jgi:hypothetical protein
MMLNSLKEIGKKIMAGIETDRILIKRKRARAHYSNP